MSSAGGAGRSVTACVLAVGTEITEGKIGDTHGRYIASALRLLSVRVRRIISIPDDRDLYESTLRNLAGECEILFITGGLGPTSDDLTREVIASAAGSTLVYREEAWRRIEERLGGRVSQTNRKQAFLPEGFDMLPNANGTAPGFFGNIGKCLLFALPGPPRELRPMFEQQVLPLLRERFELDVFEELAGTAFLTPESELEELLQRHAAPGLSWGTRVDAYGIAFFIRGGSADERRRTIDAVREEAGALRIRTGETTAARLLFDALREAQMKLAAAESCTGGLIAKLLTDIAGSSDVLWGGWVVYSNAAKVSQLAVSERTLAEYGAVSRETVREMAAGACRVSGAEAAIAVSGIAGPEGGSEEKPVGTVWIGVRAGRDALEQLFHFRGDRDRVRRLSAAAGMLLAERAIREDTKKRGEAR